MEKNARPIWKCLESKVLLDHPRITVMEDSVELPSGEITSYVRLAGHNAVTVICLRDDEILLQREYSYPVGKVLLQFPGGKIDGSETPEHAAARELREESGFTFSECERLGWYYLSNRRSDSKMYVVLAKDMTPCEKSGGDAEEDIESFWMPLGKLKVLIAHGEITNFSVLAAWALVEKILRSELSI